MTVVAPPTASLMHAEVRRLLKEDLPATLTVHYGFAPTKRDAENRWIIEIPLPYALYYGSVGDDDNPRLSGQRARTSIFWEITYVGLTMEQAVWAGEQIHFALKDRRITLAGHKTWLCRLQESQRVRRDDESTRPDGKPLFFGRSTFAASMTLTEFRGVPA
jgi:hypothetical protein